MKTYEVELRKTSYVTLTIEAETRKDAEAKAWQALERGELATDCTNWDVAFIEEIEE